MSDTKESMPAQPATKQLPAMTDRALLEDLARVVKSGFEATNERFDRFENQVDLLVEDGKTTNKRMTTLEVRLDEAEKRAASNSIRAKGASDVDAKHDAAIAKLVVKVTGLEDTQQKQLAILTRLDAVAANPTVRRVAYALGTALLAYLAAKGWIVR